MQTLTKRSLFWDVAKVDIQKNVRFIIERILNYGDEADFRWARKTYSDKKIKETLLKSRALDKKSFSFWCQYFNFDQNKCLKNQSAKK
ncbi:hypothetical protein COT96_02225 [Candidatus Falkowbacteria bacterium CG10_big_fil_rev_8_21_14_0_10_38_22]|uniref:DUF6922 domain-containing protein n=1 Tax=Candidatus Falkowbacteria bacterium CG10_big_fil_rev_8_21_14_0_10_38_22 TaxID=1974564 RepID=A0A2M6WQH2_9BACT|nr:MAG: hypothetical protein COT96_02225 [Candidatus Falkowbacteria bacterium CG10_big_fil_rev_8_21_14_0_10_38_22]